MNSYKIERVYGWSALFTILFFNTLELGCKSEINANLRDKESSSGPTFAASNSTIAINAGAAVTTSTAVTLEFAVDGATEMYITNTAECSADGAWESYATSKSWTLGQTEGTAAVYVKFRDADGNESACINDTITLAILIRGTLAGLGDGKTLVLQNNGGDDLTLTANGSFSFATPKLSGDPYSVTVWTRPSQQGCFVSNGSGTVTGAVSSVSVTCLDSRTIQMGAAGAATSEGEVAPDAFGNIFVVGSTTGGLDGNTQTGTQDFFVTKYDSSRTWQWTRQMGATGAQTLGRGVATDASGNVFVVGHTKGGLDGNTLTGTMDLFVIKYDSSGTKQWTRQMGLAGKIITAIDGATDPSGNFFVAGRTNGGLDGNTLTGINDFFVTKYDSNGTRQWTRQLGVAGKSTSGYSVATDASGNIFVAGDTGGGLDGNTLTGTIDSFVTKYDSSGTRQWTRQLGAAGQWTRASEVTTDAAGNIFASGFTYGDLDGNTRTGTRDFYLTKYDSSGTRQWTRQMGVASADTFGEGMATDASGNIFVSGSTTGGLDGNALTGTSDFFVTKYDSSGIKQWTRQMGVAGVQTFGRAGAADASGNIFVVGLTSGGLDGNPLTGTTDTFVTELWQ